MKKNLIVAALAVSAVTAQAQTIAEARLLASGSAVTVSNVVVLSIDDLVNSVNSKSFMIRDTAPTLLPWQKQACATVFANNATIDAALAGVSVGDVISLSGSVAPFNGVFQIGNTTANPLTRLDFQDLNFAVNPIVSLPAFHQDLSPVAEQLESNLVQVFNGTFVETGNFAGSTNYNLNVQGTNVIVRIPNNAQALVGTPIPTGSVNVTGILSQFDNSEPRDSGYQLLIRTAADLNPAGAFVVQGRIDAAESQRGELYGDTLAVEVLDSNGNVVSGAVNSVNFSWATQAYAVTLNASAPSPYQLRLKSDVWLSKLTPVSTDRNAIQGTLSLISGDVNNDNEVGPSDFAALAAAFGSFAGDSNFNEQADLNGDAEVGPADFAILAASFGQFGD